MLGNRLRSGLRQREGDGVQSSHYLGRGSPPPHSCLNNTWAPPRPAEAESAFEQDPGVDRGSWRHGPQPVHLCSGNMRKGIDVIIKHRQKEDVRRVLEENDSDVPPAQIKALLGKETQESPHLSESRQRGR